MKKIFSKRSGFTLVEIIIAFAIFAIMASMICQILNLMVRRKVQNKQYEEKLSAQEKTFVAKKKDWDYTAAEPDGQLVLQFQDNGGSDLTIDPIDFQLKNWDDDNPKDSINYFVGRDVDYDITFEDSIREGDEDPDSEDDDKKNAGGSTQMSRFDTRLTGTKGIGSIQIAVAHTDGTEEYQITVTVDDGGVDEMLKGHQQVTLYFAEGKSGAKPVNVVSVNDDRKDWDALREIKPCGTNGVNVHCLSDSFGGSPIIFNVELEKEIALDDLAFGQNGDASGKYTPFTVEEKDGSETTYVNIFGAYVKESKTDTDTDGDAEPTE